jgi:hypothetical protein
MQGLPGRLLVGVERQAHNQHFHPSLQHQRQEPGEIGGQIAAG